LLLTGVAANFITSIPKHKLSTAKETVKKVYLIAQFELTKSLILCEGQGQGPDFYCQDQVFTASRKVLNLIVNTNVQD